MQGAMEKGGQEEGLTDILLTNPRPAVSLLTNPGALARRVSWLWPEAPWCPAAHGGWVLCGAGRGQSSCCGVAVYPTLPVRVLPWKTWRVHLPRLLVGLYLLSDLPAMLKALFM